MWVDLKSIILRRQKKHGLCDSTYKILLKAKFWRQKSVSDARSYVFSKWIYLRETLVFL